MKVRSSKMRVLSFDRYIFRVKFPTGLHIEINTASRGFPATARLLFLLLLFRPPGRIVIRRVCWFVGWLVGSFVNNRPTAVAASLLAGRRSVDRPQAVGRWSTWQWRCRRLAKVCVLRALFSYHQHHE